MQVDLNEIENRIAAGLIRRQWTDDKTLMILNYTTKCSLERAWDEYTILTRGLILTAAGTVHARSFSKFWNVGELPGPTLEQLPVEIPVITRKLDGYLGVAYWHRGQVKIASRGSFTSEYAEWATHWLRNKITVMHGVQLLKRFDEAYSPVRGGDFTFNFEILHPKRIVCRRDWTGLILLAAIDNETGRAEAHQDLVDVWEKQVGLPVVEQFVARTIPECVALTKTIKGFDEEGYIAYFPIADVRTKLKGDDYCRIHRIATKLTRRRIWELMSSANLNAPESMAAAAVRVNEVRKAMPEEYSKWVLDTEVHLWTDYKAAFAVYESEARDWRLSYSILSRKDLAEKLQESVPGAWNLILALLDGTKYARVVKNNIWKSLRPEHEPAIIQDGEDE